MRSFHYPYHIANFTTIMARLFLLLLVSLSLSKALPTSEVVIDPREYEELHQRHRRSSPPVILPDLVVDPEINEGAYQGDMILTEEQKMERNTRKLTAYFITHRKWPTDINYSFDSSVSTEEKKAAIRAGIAHWQEHTCLRFTEQAVSPYLKFVVKSGCWSYVGKVSNNNQEISIGSGCDSLGTVAHEIGHAMGFQHEQARSDRDTYVDIVSENIASGKEGNFDKENTDNRNVPYDYSSVMHYGASAFTKNGLPTIMPKLNPLANVFMGNRDGLKFYDIKLANMAYDCIDKWMDTCSVSDHCLNDGFIGKNCECVCRPGTSGTNCENDDMDYYDALLQKEGSGIRTSVITTEGQLISDVGAEVQKHSYLIRAPECHNVVLSVTEMSMYPRSNTSSASNVCYHEYLNIRKDLSSTELSGHCAKELSSSSPSFTSVGREMVLEAKLLSTWSSKWKADVSFSNNNNCDPVTTTTTNAPTTSTTTTTTTTDTPTTTTSTTTTINATTTTTNAPTTTTNATTTTTNAPTTTTTTTNATTTTTNAPTTTTTTTNATTTTTNAPTTTITTTIAPTEITLESTISTGDCLFVKEGSDYFYRNPSYPAADSPGFNCSLSFTPSEMASHTLSLDSPRAKGVLIKYWKPRNRFLRLDLSGTPVTLMTSAGKLQVKSRVPRRNPKDVIFSIKIEPTAANQVINLVDGEEYEFVYTSQPGTEDAEYRFEAPEGKRIAIRFLEFNVGSATDRRCRNSNYLYVGRSTDYFYSRIMLFCDTSRSPPSNRRVSISNAMSLYVERKYDVEESFKATLTVV